MINDDKVFLLPGLINLMIIRAAFKSKEWREVFRNFGKTFHSLNTKDEILKIRHDFYTELIKNSCQAPVLKPIALFS